MPLLSLAQLYPLVVWSNRNALCTLTSARYSTGGDPAGLPLAAW